MRPRALVVPALAAALAAASPARADNPGVTAAPVLQVPLGARALGMGGAFTAVATDATGLQYNPAGLARLNAQEADFTYIAGAGQTTLQNLAYAGPTPLTGITGNGYTSAAANLLLSQSGTIQVNTLNPDGSLGSSQSLSAGSDVVLEGGYAERVALTPFDYGGETFNVDHFAGAGVKYLSSTLVQSYHASAVAVDLGYLAHSPEAGVSVGLAALNLGSQVRYVDVSDPLPATARLGVAWQGGTPGEHNVIAAADGQYLINEKTWRANVGVEYFFEKTYGLRMGYEINDGDQGGFTFGLGYRWKGRVLIDYAYDVGDLLGNAQRVTLSYRFGGVAPSERARQRRTAIDAGPDREDMPDLEQRQPAPDAEPRPRPEPRPENQGAPGWIY